MNTRTLWIVSVFLWISSLVMLVLSQGTNLVFLFAAGSDALVALIMTFLAVRKCGERKS